ALRSAIEDEERRAALSSVYATFAFITVPFLVFVLPRLVPSLHPTDSVINKDLKFTMGPQVRTIFFSSLTVFTLIFIWIFNILKKYNMVRRKHESGTI
ncbi:MAG: cytochrome C biogenesis protein, partial [Candidatus Zixiibacteriota bacterium]